MNGPPPASFPAFDVSKSDRTDALTVVGLTVTYRIRGRDREVLQDVSFRVRRGEAYGLVGESGCGKSTVAMAALRYLPRNGKVKAGKIIIAGQDVQKLDADALRTMRANAISMVYQDPGRALNPSLTIARQVTEAFEAAGVSRDEAVQRTVEILQRVRIASPERVMDSYPHQLSGGMQQRVVIAMALASNPALLILDEPTTGLDATVEAEVLDLVAQLREELGTAVLFISHNLAVIGRMCERVGVLYAGKLVEEGATQDVFARPRHPYTVGLLRCLPTAGRSKDTERLDTIAGNLPSPGSVTQGCIYADRCRLADDRCRHEAPPPYRVSAAHGDQMSRCHYHERAIELPRASADALPQHVGASREGERPALVLRAEKLSKTFHVSGGSAARSRQRFDRSRQWRNARPRRRIRQRQDDARETDARPAHTGCGQRARTRRHATRRARHATQRRAGQVAADRVPESGLGAQSRAFGEAADRPCVVAPHRVARRRDRRTARHVDSGRAFARALSRLAHAPVVRRAQTARGDRARVCRRAARGGLRRTRLPRSTSPCRPRSSTCSPICNASVA